jgi:hypothetical protein
MLSAVPTDITFGAEKQPGGPTQISNQPRSRIAEAGTLVQFSVLTTNTGPSCSYQWQFNGTNISGATHRSYCIENVQMTNVGTYVVVVTSKGSVESQPAYLSVYTLGCSNSNNGTLQTPIGLFRNSSFSCLTNFTHYYCPTNDSGYVAMFYGPYANPQTGPFQNTSYSSTLTIDTFSADNETADTALMLQNNFTPVNPPVCCNDDAAGGFNPKESKCGPFTLSLNTGTTKNSYRLTILYKDPPPTNGKITFNWLYQ